MSGSHQNLIPISPPKPKQKIVPKQHVNGPPITPKQRLELFSPTEFEAFVEEWASGFLGSQYLQVVHTGGAGDKGRDVIGFTGEPSSGAPRDVYQCKFYDHALVPSDVWVEFGKLCYYCWRGDLPMPRQYVLVSPKGVGAKLLNLIENPEKLRAELIKEWPKHCETHITSGTSIPLTGALLEYVKAFVFSIVGHKTPLALVEEHAQTKYHVLRFGGLPLTPPTTAPVPPQVQPHEARYVEQLLTAYSDHKQTTLDCDGLACHPKLKNHFDRARESFYQAEALRVLGRDASIDGCEFEKLQDDIYDAVVDVAEGEHKDGYERVKATTEKASLVPLDSHVLSESIQTKHRHGICHQLANEDRLVWVPE